MKRLQWVLFLGLGCFSAFAFQNIAQLKDSLTSTHYEFQELAVDLPFSQVYSILEEEAREKYKEAGRNILQAIKVCEQNPRSAAELVEKALYAYREVGMLLPMYRISSSTIKTVILRYLKAEDVLRDCINKLTLLGLVPIAYNSWRNNGLVWKLLSNKLGVTNGIHECSRVREEKSGHWRMPSLRELARVFRDMKNPEKNASFGTAASRFIQVWTSDPKAQENQQYYVVNFRDELSETAEASTPLTVVCVGDELAE